MKQVFKTLLAAMAVVLTAAPAFAVKNTGGEYNSMHAGLGAKGYDVVAYFTEGRPVAGDARYEHVHGGVTWRFASQKHRDLFAADPGRYAPQYGGFCSWGAAQGKLFDVDPVNGWTVHDNKLYLNFNADLNKTFKGDAQGLVAKADRNWPQLNR